MTFPMPCASAQAAVAVLVFFARTTGTGFIATNLAAVTNEGLRLLRGGGRLAAGTCAIGLGVLVFHRRFAAALAIHGVNVLLIAYANTVQPPHHIVLHAVEHFGKQLEAFALVLLFRLFLRKAAQPPAAAQVVHGRQVLFPVLVENRQHERFFRRAL